MFIRLVRMCLLSLLLVTVNPLYAEDVAGNPLVGSWLFSGVVANENGEQYGYFFQVLRQAKHFHTKMALIDGRTNALVFSYEGEADIEKNLLPDWHVGLSFIRYNPINDSWMFGVKTKDKKGFHFKVDMLGQKEKSRLSLRPGVELEVLQTSRLNGHIQTGTREQFVTGNKDWFATIWFSKEQKKSHAISTTFCRLNNGNGFYSASLKEPDATDASVARWRDVTGRPVNMSQFVSVQPLDHNTYLLKVGAPRLQLTLLNTLEVTAHPIPKTTPLLQSESPLPIAGFSKEHPGNFCFLAKQAFDGMQSRQIG